MPPKKQPAASKKQPPAPAEEGIPVPQFSGIPGQGADTDDLISAQEKLFGKKTTNNKNGKQKEEKPDKEEPAQKTRSRAEEIFDITQNGDKNLNGKTKKAAAKDDGEEFDKDFPDFDASQFLKDEDDKEKFEPEPDEDERKEEEDVDLDKETNIKNLRQVAGRFKGEVKTLSARITELEAELSSKPADAAMQKQVDELRNRVQQLEPYEIVFALHENPAFKEKFIDGPNKLRGEMLQIIKDYDVEEEVLDHILYAKNRKELDSILEDSFSSLSAQHDLKSLRQRYQGLMSERAEAEKKPREALERYNTDKATFDAEKNRRRDLHLQTVMQSGWEEAIEKAADVATEKKIYELMEVPGKKDHNEKVVRPTLAQAQNILQDGLGYIEKLARTGGVPSKAFVSWFATICQQAAATQMVNSVRWGMHEQLQELKKQVTKRNGYENPSISSPSRNAPVRTEGDQKKKSGRERAAQIFQEVVSSDM